MNFDENVNFAAGSDTGQASSTSIQPILQGETVWPGTPDRPLENLRARTETIRRKLQDLLYYADSDRALILRSDATFTLTQPSAGQYALASTGDLWVYPSLTPGHTSGGRYRGGRVFVGAQPYSGLAGINDLILTAHDQHVAGRGYSDGDDYSSITAPYPLSIGANRLIVSVTLDTGLGASSVAFSVTGTPKTLISITYGASVKVSDLITAINGDLSSQGSYGVGHYLFAATTASSPGSVSPTPFTSGVVQGEYDAEAHLITAAALSTFFNATVGGLYVNQLLEGEGLAIGYPLGPVESASSTAYPSGGRRQSIFDLPTTRTGGLTDNTASGGNLFSTGREPEKIPGSVPIGKIVNGEFVFIDGTRIAPGESIQLSASRVMYSQLASQVLGASGSALIGYDGSGFWNGDSGTPTSLPASTLNVAIDSIVALLAASTASNSGARRIGMESVPATTTTGNVGLAMGGSSIRDTLTTLLNKPASTGVAGGINYRMSEFGHQMHGPNPILKDFRETTPENLTGGGGVLIQSISAPPVDSMWPLTAAGSPPRSPVQMSLKPFVANLTYGGRGAYTLHATETVASPHVAGAGRLQVSSLSSAAFTAVLSQLALLPTSDRRFMIAVVQLSGAAASNGYYLLKAIDFTAHDVTLSTLAGGAPDFTSITFPASISFFTGAVEGDSPEGNIRQESYLNLEAPRELITIPPAPSGHTAAPVLRDVYRASNTPGSAAILVGQEAADWQVWNEVDATDTTIATRDSHNILVTSDKGVLDGQERLANGGTVPDGSRSHVHSNLNGVYLFPAGGVQLLSVTDLHTATTLTNHPVSTNPTAIPSHYMEVGAVIGVTGFISGTGGSIGDGLQLQLNFYSDATGTTGQPNGVGRIDVVGNVLVPAAGNKYAFSAQFVVPVNIGVGPPNHIYYQISVRSGNITASALLIYQYGSILQQLTT